MGKKVFSGVDRLPDGIASDHITPGCLVLEGGAFRGVYGEGVLDALMEADINLECTVGVSAGALNGLNYVSGQIGRSARMNLRYRHDSRYISLRHFHRNGGIICLDFPLRHMPGEALNETRFFSPAQRFLAVATDLLTGETVYFDRDSCSDILLAIKASASMPYVSRPVTVDGKPCLDGGCSTKIAYTWALEQNFEKIVIIRTRPADFRYQIKESRLPYRFYRKYPAFAKTLAASESKYNTACDEIDALEKQGRLFVIAPSRDPGVKRLESDMEKLGALYYLGYQDGKNAVSDLLHYLSSHVSA